MFDSKGKCKNILLQTTRRSLTYVNIFASKKLTFIFERKSIHKEYGNISRTFRSSYQKTEKSLP